MIDKKINLDNRKIIVMIYIIFFELFENDDIENFFELDENNLREKYESHDIILLQYEVINSSPQPKDFYFSFSSGKIKSSNEREIFYEIPILYGSLGSPIILGNNNHYLIGIHSGYKKNFHFKVGINLYSL